MISPARLESYMRRAAAWEYESIDVPPFVLFFNPEDPLPFSNYARPVEPISAETTGILLPGQGAEPAYDMSRSLAVLSAEFHARQRMPRFEFVEEYAPALATVLETAGFLQEARLLLMTCDREGFRMPPPVPGLQIAPLTNRAPAGDLRTFRAVQSYSFDESRGDFPGSLAEIEKEENGGFLLTEGHGAFLARLNDQPVGAAAYTVPLDGLTELVGIGTLAPHRGRGIGAALTAQAVKSAFESGVEVAFLVAEDERAGRVYTRVGFRPFATVLMYSQA